jgi:long-chain acyl-CoA synthetase
MRRLIRATPPRAPKIDVSMDDVAALQYTGGTTGVPKGAMLTHRNLSFNAQQIRAWFTNLEPGKEVWLSSLPFFHVFGLTVSMNLPVVAGAAMVVMPNPRDIPGMIRAIARHRVTVFPAVPAQFHAINNYPGVESIDLSSVKVCVSGSAPLPLDVQTRFEDRTGSKIVEGFGLTEASPVTHATPLLGKRKIGGIGLPLPATDAKVVDIEDGKTELPRGEDGELVVRGPQVTWLARTTKGISSLRAGRRT